MKATSSPHSPVGRLLVLLALTAGAGVFDASAQGISGTVVDGSSAIGVGMGFVVLLDENDAEVMRTLTDADGAFAFRRVRPGRYRLKSERIGYSAVETPLFEFGPRETQTFRIEIELLPLRLSSIEIREETNCRNRPGEGEATALLWEEIRKALAAATWTSAQRGYRYRHTMYLRDLDRNAERVESEQTEEKTGFFRTPFLSRSAEELAEHGYAVEEDGDIWFYAPDDQVLQHDAFLSTRCFRVVRDTTGEQVRIGLAFEPERGRRNPDIAGVLWLDERSSELRTLEYEYRNLVGGVEDDRLGGTLRLPATPQRRLDRLPFSDQNADSRHRVHSRRFGAGAQAHPGGEGVPAFRRRGPRHHDRPR
ncbi:MAG: carboxypeptidase-like regulatory domain-containing protein [Gemmatimonadetes bacterium]|nr:carboxypeptidase-like regulatory domain-containing protein [Gemmatimonadota bacterium]